MRIRALSRPDSFFTLPPDAKVDPEVARHFRRNFTVNLLDQWNYPALFVTSAVFVVGGRCWRCGCVSRGTSRVRRPPSNEGTHRVGPPQWGQ